jgi:hypothetical protein
VFKYLGRLLAQDDDDIQAVRQQIRKAWGIWARVGQVLRGENTTPCVAAKFYGSGAVCAPLREQDLERFISASPTRWLGNTNLPKVCLGIGYTPRKKDMLEECGLHPVKDYIDTRGSTIAMYVVNRPIFRECQEGERMRGSMPSQWW